MNTTWHTPSGPTWGEIIACLIFIAMIDAKKIALIAFYPLGFLGGWRWGETLVAGVAMLMGMQA